MNTRRTKCRVLIHPLPCTLGLLALAATDTEHKKKKAHKEKREEGPDLGAASAAGPDAFEARLQAAFDRVDIDAMRELYGLARQSGASKRLLEKVRRQLDLDAQVQRDVSALMAVGSGSIADMEAVLAQVEKEEKKEKVKKESRRSQSKRFQEGPACAGP
mmetsp:Transcript_111251/g.345124  ORF Transcript_111251/g.345124 Transcript_111251/m.345124 type:complete len:160 (+) Transcript_111251:154-633(+)